MMTKNMVLPLFNNQILNHKPLSPELQQEQAVKLKPFYERLIAMTFAESATAIEHCRDLCAEYGFTVKQEASTHRNIYVYCSREGLADSLRNPKTNPQRRRPSKRCDCRWRVVLFETNGRWEFRKSLNPEASLHNHELMDPNEIERSWPKEVTNMIFELARQRLTTQEVRIRVQTQFPGINWNERRFYNRLSEERQKIKLRDSVERTHQLNALWGRLCMAAAGNDDLCKIVEQQLSMLFQSVCETIQVDPQFFPEPTIHNDNDHHHNNNMNNNNSYRIGFNDTFNQLERNKKQQPKQETYKGYLPVEIPTQVYHVKIHSQRQLQETQILRNQKRQRTSSEESMLELSNEYPKIKSRHSSLIPLHGSSSSSSETKSPDAYSTSNPLHQSYRGHSSLHPVTSNSMGPSPSAQDPFVYAYNNQLALDSIQSYVQPSFQNNFSISTSTGAASNEFNTQGISFEFNTPQSLVKNTRATTASSSNTSTAAIDTATATVTTTTATNNINCSTSPQHHSLYSTLHNDTILTPKPTSSSVSTTSSPIKSTHFSRQQQQPSMSNSHSAFYPLHNHVKSDRQTTSCDPLPSQPSRSQLHFSPPQSNASTSSLNVLTKSPMENNSFPHQIMYAAPATTRPF